MKHCSIPECLAPIKSLGLCQKHYMRQRRTGDALTVRPPGVPGNSRKHPLYSAWAGMVNRCHNPNHSSFSSYGALGISVCSRWRSGADGLTGFECYLADMGERPNGMSIDRIDPTCNYEPNNCRWASAKVQRHNQSVQGTARAALTTSRKKLTNADQLTPIGRAIREIATERGESINALAKRYGYASQGYIRGVSLGLKAPSERLIQNLEADGKLIA